ncbi:MULTISPECIES: hypothetical protein [unclassified Rathayibacter]|uniref:hypothetical protein n=1 Tax=unclassified Rathayibacter TaxID=2609250 RepID=UPI0012E93525|nr:MULTISPECIES: hypothetical protein [unclassified Rathayibacter]
MADRNSRMDERGRHVKLIRWRNTRSGWVTEVAIGQVEARDVDGWLLDVGGTAVRYDAKEWSVFRS